MTSNELNALKQSAIAHNAAAVQCFECNDREGAKQHLLQSCEALALGCPFAEEISEWKNLLSQLELLMYQQGWSEEIAPTMAKFHHEMALREELGIAYNGAETSLREAAERKIAAREALEKEEKEKAERERVEKAIEFSNGVIIKYNGTDTKVKIPDTINGQKVTVIGEHAFEKCTSMTSVDIPCVTTIGEYAFAGCKSLKSVFMPSSVPTIGKNAFRNCNALYDTSKKDIQTINPAAINSGCYVATAVYGSYDCPQVWTLRRYRDFALAESLFGRAFIRVYYAVSPTLVKRFGKKIWFNHLWRGVLDRKLQQLRSIGIEDTPYVDRVW